MLCYDDSIPLRSGTSVERPQCCSFLGSSPAPGGKRVISTIDASGVNGEIQTIDVIGRGLGGYGGR